MAEAPSTCRDCGATGIEEPDDPAPGLCPTCYAKRLDKIGARFSQMCDSLDHPSLVCMWLEQALIEVAGETEDAAHEHAGTLYEAMMKVEAVTDS